MPSLHFPHARRTGGRAPLHPWISRSALGVLLVAGAVGLAACGGSSGGSAATTAAAGGTGTFATTTATSPGTTTTGGGGGFGGGANAAAFTKYTSCLKQHGVTLPTRRPGGGGFGGGGGGAPTGTTGTSTTPRRQGGGAFNNPKFRAAQTACAKLLPAGFRGGFGRGGGGGFGGGGNTAAFAAYRNCLTLHGVKLAAGGFGRPGANGGAKPTAKVTKALAACASLRPKFTRRPPTSTAPPTTTTS